MYGYAQSETVEYGHDGKHPVTYHVSGIHSDDLPGECIEVVAAKTDTFADARGSSGVEDHRCIHAVVFIPVPPVETFPGCQEIIPHQNGSIGRDLVMFAPFGQVVSKTDNRSHLVLYRCDDQCV